MEDTQSNEKLRADKLQLLKNYLERAIRFDGKQVTDDMNIYRYLPKDRFLDMIEHNHLILTHISIWEDPFEGFLFKTGDQTESLRRTYAGFYGQSWTFGNYETDLRWRAYCPNGDGIRIKTTVGELRKLLNQIFDPDESRTLLLTGPVIYVDNEWRMSLSHGFVQRLPEIFYNTKGRFDSAEWLFIKRRYFEQEKEFRVICHIGHAGLRELPKREDSFERSDGLLKCKFANSVNQFLKEIVLDPRMSLADVDRIKCRLMQSDVNVPVQQSEIYQWPKQTGQVKGNMDRKNYRSPNKV